MALSRRRFFHSLTLSAAALTTMSRADDAIATATRIEPPSSLRPPFRLPVSWYLATVKRFQAKLKEQGLAGAIVADPLNRNYLTGLFLTETERPNFLFVPAEGEPTAFIPGLDRDMVGSWWIKNFEWYFDYMHAGEYNKVVWKAGPAEDLFLWMLKGVSKRGFGKRKLGIDREPTPSVSKKFKATLPEASLTDIARLLLHMREIKTPEEIELTEKAIDLQDRMLMFAREYILEHGSDVRDYDVRTATSEWATRELMRQLPLDGRPHNGVGINLSFGCRAGVSTAYPHPNQFFYQRLERGQPVQIAARITIGGYGGEGYRALHIEPMTDPQRRMWEVHNEMTLVQADLSKAGARCNEIAEKVLAVAEKAGMEKYVYHRPAHGAGMEGHQAPYVALGDQTVLEENMMFSNEPGLYNPEGGYGYNHSNTILVERERGRRMNQVPLTKEWCWLKL